MSGQSQLQMEKRVTLAYACWPLPNKAMHARATQPLSHFLFPRNCSNALQSRTQLVSLAQESSIHGDCNQARWAWALAPSLLLSHIRDSNPPQVLFLTLTARSSNSHGGAAFSLLLFFASLPSIGSYLCILEF